MTGGVNLSDLPPAVRTRVLAEGRKVPSREKTGSLPALQRATSRGGDRWRCHHCGNEETALAKAERHADETGHVRVEVIL